MEKSITIIGAGIAGLAAGCYGRMNGYRTKIFEMHTLPGGLCTAWKRQDYTIDLCIHWLVGSKPGAVFHRIWEELGAVQGRQFVNAEEFMRYEDPSGKTLTLYCDIDRLEEHMLELAPEDREAIRELTGGIRACLGLEMPLDLEGVGERLKFFLRVMPKYLRLGRWQRQSAREFVAKFKNPLIRKGLLAAWPPAFPMTFLLMTFAWLDEKNAGYPVGGSLEFARSIEKRYRDLGGEISYNSRVTKVLVEQDRAVGVRLADGSEHRADYVISAADGHTTIFELLERKYLDEKIKGYYEKLPLFPALVFIGLGVNRSFPEIPHLVSGLVLELPEPVKLGDREHGSLMVRIHNVDPTLAPPGKTVLTVMLPSDLAYWEELRKDQARYQAEKERIADEVIALLDRRFPGLAAQVEVRDVATPSTFVRYTGNWQGSFEGWMVTPQTWNIRMNKTLPGLANFYMAGQWVEPGGGLPPAAASGRGVIKMICKNDGRRFLTTVP
ncbi:MAG: NAD(P)/FAD-dependent oxidoreductase [Candidatus Acetothermia bacterium]|jgi:phytoene dehydrogenase-like protein|nr:NAD(P)/FAD-dependent oxidoreductase [Candidatus Acetothermia bacterium]MDH7505313.1 NAD(P)/FAD-dependent oxidoreductase [Candidatus Acetothermia bacterium]